MNPVLYKADERSFRTFGLGEISDAYKVTVTRERNGNYDLYIKYPVNGHFASVFKVEMKIKADAGKRTKWQTFEINRIVKDSSEHIEIYARHISMRTSDIALKPIVKASKINAETALRLWKESLVGDDVFDVSSDIQTLGNISWEVDKVGSARKALGGVSGSILDVFGGEFEFDNNLIILHKQMGRKAPTVLEYGRNLLSVEEESLLDGNYTSIYPFARYTPSSNGSSEGSHEESREVLVTLPEHILDSPYLRLYAQRRISLVDFSSKFDDKHPPTAEKLRSLGQSYIKTNNIGAPKISTEVSYVDLSHTLDYQDFGVMEEVELCDIIPLYYPQFDITTTTEKVVKVVYDVYTDSNEEITLGTIGQSLSSSMTAGIADRLSVVEERQASIESTLPQYLISGTGNKIWHETPAKNVEHKIGDTWFEKNGQYQRMYIWNGSMWEKRLDTEDVDRVKKEVDKQFEAVNTKMAGIEAKHDQTVSDLLKKSNATQELANASKLLAQEAKNASNSTGQELSLYKQDNERNLSILRNQATQIDGKAVQALNKANQTATETTNLIANLRTDLNGKVSLADFQSVKETSALYERILGRDDSNISTNIARMALTSDLFNVEVGKRFSNLTNLFYAPTKIPKFISSVDTDKHLERVSLGDHDGIRINYTDSMSGWLGVRFPLTKKFVKQGEGLGYRIEIAVDKVPKDGRVLIQLLDNTTSLGMYYNSQITLTKTGNQVFTGYLDIPRTGELNEYSIRFTLSSPGNIVIHKPMIIDRRLIPEEFVDSTDYNSEYTRTTMSILKDSFAFKTLNSNGDVLSALNVATGGASLQVGKNKLVVTPDTTFIANGTIKNAMIDNLDAGKIRTGTLDANLVNVVNLNASSITSGKLSANLINGGVLSALNGNSTFDLNNGLIQMQSGPTSWKTSWNKDGIAFRGPNNDIWGAMGGDSGGGVGIYMRGDHAFNLVVNHTDKGKSYAYTPLRVKYGEGTTLQFSPGGPSYNLLTLFRTIFDNFKYNDRRYYDMR
jgi:phage minor structural protein, N-terminal domain protein|uniref:Tail protein n=2 Tax=unclassified Caudoviricetes TaxID=2788787 RepID=A0A8S5MQS0_9CAUD|nr:MAG TPA: tail protein [Siphoviridae sp. ctHSm42]DAD93123.1 MAG TPA: tail protein [Siphoviridae sp. ctFxs15]